MNGLRIKREDWLGFLPRNCGKGCALCRRPGRPADEDAGVRERIEELKAEASAKCSLSREAYIKSLVEMYEAKPSEASMDNSRCDVVVVRGQKQAVFPPKLQVGQQLAKLVNWEGSIKVELEAGENLASFLRRLFVGGGTLPSRNDRYHHLEAWRSEAVKALSLDR
jgi:hypothetical protein